MLIIKKFLPIHYFKQKIFEVKYIKTIHLSSWLMYGKKRKTWEDIFDHSYRMFNKCLKYWIYDALIIKWIFLHDIVEDSSFSLIDISNKFWEDLTFIVEALTCVDNDNVKIDKNIYYDKFIKYSKKQRRILVIKLLDIIDNLETIHWLNPKKQEKFIREKKDIFFPIFQESIKTIPYYVKDIYINIFQEFNELLIKNKYGN